MHGVLPSRKTSHPPPYAARSSRMSSTRRRQLQLGAILACSALLIILMISRLFASSEERIPPGTPEVVFVTLIDEETMSKEYIGKIQENRRHYASRHGMTPLTMQISKKEEQGANLSRQQVMRPSFQVSQTTSSVTLPGAGLSSLPFATL